jgi:hypothetical protein
LKTILLGYRKNNSEQSKDSLAESLSDEEKTDYSSVWKKIKASNTDPYFLAKYLGADDLGMDEGGDENITETTLFCREDAQNESARRINLYAAPYRDFELNGYDALFGLDVGDAVEVIHERFGFASGLTGQVHEVQLDPVNKDCVIVVRFYSPAEIIPIQPIPEGGLCDGFDLEDIVPADNTENGYWIAQLNGKEGVSTRYKVASNGNGTILCLSKQDTLQRSTDYGITYTEVTVPGLLATDIKWSGNYFVGCDALGNIYYSADGETWYGVADGAGYRLDKISGVGDWILAAGEKIYGYDIATQIFTDYTDFSNWVETGCAAMFFVPDGQYILAASADNTRLYRCQVSDGSMTSFLPNGISDKWITGIYSHEIIVALMIDGRLYYSTNGGVDFVLWLEPPPDYNIYDLIYTRRPELLAIMERNDGNSIYRRVFSSIGGGFVEIIARLIYSGRQMLLQENSREIVFDVTNSTNAVLDSGIETDYLTLSAVDADGINVDVPYQITAPGVVTLDANQAFSGKVTLTISSTTLESSL